MNTQNTSKQCQSRRYHRLCSVLASWAAVFLLAGWVPTSWGGTVACTRNGIVAPPQGSLKIGDKLTCGNQGSGGGDVDIFTIRSASGCPYPIVEVVALGTGQKDLAVENQIQVTFLGSIPSTAANPNEKNLVEGTTGIVYICANTPANYSAAWDTDPPPVVDVDNDPYDPDAIKSKILVLSFNPILENATDVAGNPIGPISVSKYINLWEDPSTLADRYINTMFEASKNLNGSAMARYKIADVLEMDAWPVYWPQSVIEQSNDQDFLTRCPAGTSPSDACWGKNIGQVDLGRTVRSLGLDQRVMAGEIDEVLWPEYVGTPGENAMFGEGAFYINSHQTVIPPQTKSTRAIPNTTISCLECLTHRLETTLNKMFGAHENYDTMLPYMWSGVFPDPLTIYGSTSRAYGSISHAWNRFAMIDKLVDRRSTSNPNWRTGAIGLAHFPVDARGNYDFLSGAAYGLPKAQVRTNADDWLKYPNMTCKPSDYSTTGDWPLISCEGYDQPNPLNCDAGAQASFTDPSNGKLIYKGYQTWMLKHVPHATGINSGYTCGNTLADYYPKDKGLLNNWWRYLMDVDQFKWGDGRLNQADWTIPKVTISAMEQLIYNIGGQAKGKTQWVPRPAPGKIFPLPGRVHGHVGITVAVTDPDPIYRVDLYVDGRYHSTDTIRPYTFHWDASALSGQHKLVAKAYDMPNGRKGISAEVAVTVDPIGANYTPGFKVYNSGTGREVKADATIAGKVGEQVSLPLMNSENNAMTYCAQNLPDGATLSALGTTMGHFTWTPVAEQNGPQWIRFIATNPATCGEINPVTCDSVSNEINPATCDSSSVDVVIGVAK